MAVALALVGMGAGCASVWEPLGEDYGAAKEPEPALPSDPFPASEEPNDFSVTVTGTLEERYPFVRFFQRDGDWHAGLIVVPKEMGESICTVALDYLTDLFNRPDSPPELRLVSDAGQSVLSTDLDQPPWNSDSKIQRVEDVLYVAGLEEDIEQILGFIDFFWSQAPQIEIQAQIVSNTNNESFERGIVPINSSTPLITNSSGLGPDGEGPFFRAWGGGFPTPTGQTLTSGPGGVLQLSLLANDLQFNALLQFLAANENVDIVSRPRVVVRNGVKADLSSVEEFPFLKATNVSAQGVTNQLIEYRDVGVKLIVQPFLLGDDNIILNIEAEVNRVGREVTLTTDPLGNPVDTPTFNKRSARTNVMVRHGQSVVIGGLRLKESRTVKSKVPILGDIPVLELFFSSSRDQEVTTEVTFIIKPEIKTRAASISAFEDDIFDPFAEMESAEPN